MKDEEEYFRVIEEYFLQKRGNPVLLSPKEWTLIREWYELNIPEEVVLRGIDRAFEPKEGKDQDDTNPTSLVYCKRIVKSEFKRYLKSQEGANPAISKVAPEAENIHEFLQRLVSSIRASSNLARESGNTALADILEDKRIVLEQGIVKEFETNPSKDLQRVEHQLTTIEKEIEEVLLQTVSEERISLLKEDAMHDLNAFQDKVELPVYQEMIRRSLIKSLRKLYGIPRLSLFYM
jgi:hypothetical protein